MKTEKPGWISKLPRLGEGWFQVTKGNAQKGDKIGSEHSGFHNLPDDCVGETVSEWWVVMRRHDAEQSTQQPAQSTVKTVCKTLAKCIAQDSPVNSTLHRRETKTVGRLPPSDDGKYIIRYYDMFDGWIDIEPNLSAEKAIAKWEEKTKGGTTNVCYGDGEYYDIFPNGTRMFVTPQSLGR